MSTPRSFSELEVRPAGDRALLLLPHATADLDVLGSRLRAALPAGVSDVIPAAETILLTTEAGSDLARVEREVRSLLTGGAVDRAAQCEEEVVEVGVHYDGPDLADVARLLEMTPAEVVAAHTGRLWRCQFIGFTAGFGYLRPDEPTLVVPRRDSPRTQVPTGSVALADGYTAVYPRPSPGGWQLIGTTATAMWDLDRSRPALLTPGTHVRFVDLDAR